MAEDFSISNISKAKYPVLPFFDLKNDILGKNYSLSIAMVTEKISCEINTRYRRKNKSTNVLSFPLSKNEGELILCPKVIKRESKDKEKNFGKNYRDLFGFLVIHGMLHLKGYEHGSKMESEEEKYKKIFKISSLPNTN
jgi:probable rRNA maturation factor